MSAFTKGPWAVKTRAELVDGGDYIKPVDPQTLVGVVSSDGFLLAELTHLDNEPDERAEVVADATLMAASPDLYDAVLAIVGATSDDDEGTDTDSQTVTLTYAEIRAARTALAKAEGRS